ncbi:MAG: DUF2961 domain-containing protein [Clostridiales bacterium]|nr:DUF2961 domain-containing protein [Clostridiales bacterium]
MSFDGLFVTPASLPLLSGAKTRSISAENPRGEKGQGARATTGTGANCARELGVGWKIAPSVAIAPGEVYTLADIEGPGAIQSIWLTGGISRDFILRIHWDGQEAPSVECPVPDFFGCGWFNNTRRGYKFSHLNSLMVCVNPNHGLNCFWQMPFRKHCRMTLENCAAEPRTCYYQINYALDEVPAQAAYFHAQFRRVNPLPYKEEYTIVDGIKGRGHYVGTALSVGLNGAGNWWGEGEIKFFMDGDEHPTICGTGTEDYFLGAYDWDVDGKYVTYSTPYAGMFHVEIPDGLYKSQQRFSMYRWHVVDPIRFESDLRVTLQDLGWRSGGRYLPREDDLASVAFWYQELPAAPFPPLPDADTLEVI